MLYSILQVIEDGEYGGNTINIINTIINGIEVPVVLHRHIFWISNIGIYWNITMSGTFEGGFADFLGFNPIVYILLVCLGIARLRYMTYVYYKQLKLTSITRKWIYKNLQDILTSY